MNQSQKMIGELRQYETGELNKLGKSIGVAQSLEGAQDVVHRNGIDYDGTSNEGGDTIFMQAGRVVARWMPKPDGMVSRIDNAHAPGTNP